MGQNKKRIRECVLSVNTAFADNIINPCFSCLRELKPARDIICFSVLYEACACLMKAKCYAVFDALATQIEYPIKITGASGKPGFASCRNLFDTVADVFRNIDFFKQRSGYYQPVLYRQGKKYRKTKLCHLIVFDGTPDDDVFVAVAPVRREAIGKAVDTLCKKHKEAVGALFYHFPASSSPFVRVL